MSVLTWLPGSGQASIKGNVRYCRLWNYYRGGRTCIWHVCYRQRRRCHVFVGPTRLQSNCLNGSRTIFPHAVNDHLMWCRGPQDEEVGPLTCQSPYAASCCLISVFSKISCACIYAASKKGPTFLKSWMLKVCIAHPLPLIWAIGQSCWLIPWETSNLYVHPLLFLRFLFEITRQILSHECMHGAKAVEY